MDTRRTGRLPWGAAALIAAAICALSVLGAFLCKQAFGPKGYGEYTAVTLSGNQGVQVTGDGFVAQKPLRRSHWDCVVCDEHFWGGYPHLFFYSNPQMAKNFLNRCEQYHRQKEGI